MESAQAFFQLTFSINCNITVLIDMAMVIALDANGKYINLCYLKLLAMLHASVFFYHKCVVTKKYSLFLVRYPQRPESGFRPRTGSHKIAYCFCVLTYI